MRYRGYVYDQETRLYYLQSRYYNPEIGRFINADALISTGQGLLGNNMFAYCLNNPISYADSTGNMAVLNNREILGCYGGSYIPSSFGAASPTISHGSAAGTVLATAAGGAALISSAIAANEAKLKKSKTYSVYTLQDKSGRIQYVGRVTDIGYSARMNYHYNTRGLTPANRISGLNYATARGLEEILMIECHTLNPSNPTNNQIHGISIKNPNGAIYLDAAYNYLFNHAEDFLLNLLQ